MLCPSSGDFKTPQQQKRIESEKVFTEKDHLSEMPQEVAKEMVGTAFIKAMDGQFAKLYSKIDNLKMEVSTLKTTDMLLWCNTYSRSEKEEI